jgi:short-subunit dehydrogenase
MSFGPAKASAACKEHPVVITGAGGDLGREVATLIVRRGGPVALVDNDQDRLQGTFDSCSGLSPDVTRWAADVSSWSEMALLAAKVRNDLGPVHALFNLAGLIHAGPLLDSDPEDLERVVRVDLLGTMASCRAFLPHLLETGHGQIVNVSSAFGLVAVGGYSSYNAAKFGVRGFTEALQQELDSSRVAVAVVYLGGAKTGIMRRATFAKTVDSAYVQDRFDRSVARMSPARAAEKIVTGVAKGRSRLVVGLDAAGVDVLARVAGVGYQRVTRRMGLKHHPG